MMGPSTLVFRPCTLPRIIRPASAIRTPAYLCAVRHFSASVESSQPPVIVRNIKAPGNGHIRVLSLNVPATRNAISKALLQSLRTQVDAIAAQYDVDGVEIPQKVKFGSSEDGPTRVLIIASENPKSFCAGADLKERMGFTPEETAGFLSNLRNTFSALAALPIPTISAISSVALGGGLELALCTNLRVFASTAQVGLPETRLGIIPGAGGTYRLPALIGLSKARDLILTGRVISAEEAYRLGIADRLVDISPTEGNWDEGMELKLKKQAHDEALNEALNLANTICQGAPTAVRSALKAVGAAEEVAENKMYERVVGTEDRNEALLAFKEKRRPVFTGK